MMSLRSLTLAPLFFVMAGANHLLRKAADGGASAVDSLHIEFPNPPNAWHDEKTGLWYSQTQVFLHNEADKAICNIKVTVPLSDAADAKVFSSYVYDLKASKTGLEATPSDYAKKIEPEQMANFGFIIQGPTEDAVKTGDIKVANATFCDEGDSKPSK